jgi:hypothetical protein
MHKSLYSKYGQGMASTWNTVLGSLFYAPVSGHMVLEIVGRNIWITSSLKCLFFDKEAE